HDFVKAKARNSQPRHGVRICPRPGYLRLSAANLLVPGTLNQNPCQFCFCAQVGGAAGERQAGNQQRRGNPTQYLHADGPTFLSSNRSRDAKASAAMPSASKNASALPVAGAPKTLSVCMPSGNSLATAVGFDCPPGFTIFSSTATSDVKRVTSL